MTANAPIAPEDRLARLLQALSGLVAGQGLLAGIAGPVIILICARLRRLARLFAVAAARPNTPHKPPRRPSRPRRDTPPTPRPLPRNRAWLVRLLPATSGAAGQLHQLLADPDMLALIASRPSTGRALRPLCHMLGIAPPPSLRRSRTQRAAPKPRPERPDNPAPPRQRRARQRRARKPPFLPWLSPAFLRP